MNRIVARAGFPPNSHDGKALLHILETFSRNELFQASEDELYEMALGILRLQDRQRIALFVRKDPFERFVSSLRLRAARPLHDRAAPALPEDPRGELRRRRLTAFSSHFGEETALVRLHFIIRTNPGQIPAYSIPEITRAARRGGHGPSPTG